MNEKELRELDAWIAEHVMGWTDVELYHPPAEFTEEPSGPFWRGVSKMSLLWQSVPNYSKGAAAFQVLEKCAAMNCIQIRQQSTGLWCVWEHQVCDEEFNKDMCALGENLPVAICLFAKKLFSK